MVSELGIMLFTHYNSEHYWTDLRRTTRARRCAGEPEVKKDLVNFIAKAKPTSSVIDSENTNKYT